MGDFGDGVGSVIDASGDAKTMKDMPHAAAEATLATVALPKAGFHNVQGVPGEVGPMVDHPCQGKKNPKKWGKKKIFQKIVKLNRFW